MYPKVSLISKQKPGQSVIVNTVTTWPFKIGPGIYPLNCKDR